MAGVFLRFTVVTVCAAAAMALAGCQSKGESAPPPNNVAASGGDQTVVVTFDAEPSVQYWVYQGGSPDLSPQNWSVQLYGRVFLDVRPPVVVCGVPNGVSVYYTVTGRIDGGPGGDPSPVAGTATRAAGSTWQAGTALAGELRGVGYAPVIGCTPNALPTGAYAAVGAGGLIYTSGDGATWTARTAPPAFTTPLHAVAGYATIGGNASSIRFVAVGDGGAVLVSDDSGATWSQAVPYNAGAPALRAVVRLGTAFYAAGDNGILQSSSDGITWTSLTSNTTANLNAIFATGARWVAVGDAGTIVTSADAGATWTAQTVAGVGNLRAGAFGNNYNEAANTGLRSIDVTVAVGDSGQAARSTDGGVTWSATPVSAGADLVALSYITRFIALDSAGNVYASVDGITWTAGTTGATGLRALATNGTGYVAVGAGGVNLRSF